MIKKAMTFYDRMDAGRQLGLALQAYANDSKAIILALPRGGVPIAHKIAEALHIPWDLLLVRKIGLPGQEELAIGAIANGNVQVLNEDLIRQLAIPGRVIDKLAVEERKELDRRNRLYRQGRLIPKLAGRTVILVDDGCATGANMRAAIQAVRVQNPSRIVAAVPVASDSAYEMLQQMADEVACPLIPQHFYGVGAYYDDFSQVSDQEVINFLQIAQASPSYSEGLSKNAR